MDRQVFTFYSIYCGLGFFLSRFRVWSFTFTFPE